MNFTQWNRGSTVRSFIFTQTYSINTDNLHFKTHFLFGFFIKHGFMYQCSSHSLKVRRIAFRLHWKFIETSLKTSLMIILKKWECGTNPTLSGNFCCPVPIPCYMEQEAWILNHVSKALILSSFFLGEYYHDYKIMWDIFLIHYVNTTSRVQEHRLRIPYLDTESI